MSKESIPIALVLQVRKYVIFILVTTGVHTVTNT